MSLPEMPCRELVEVVTEYLEGTLPDTDRTRFEAHLTGCLGCQAYLDQMRRSIALTGSVPEDSLEPAQRERLQELFRGWKGE